MKQKKIRRRPVEAVRMRMIESYARRIVRRSVFEGRDFFDFRPQRRGVEVRFQEYS